jgi:hypothetical protein
MITIIPPSEFKTVPWKNGKGVTVELAISAGGTLNDFDWRLSIATVASDGLFSNFTGMTRNLVLIEGNGIRLEHTDADTSTKVDTLTSLLDVARFDGGNKTVGTLIKGSIKDFNIMVKADKYSVVTHTYRDQTTAPIPDCDLCFVYSLPGGLDDDTQFRDHKDEARATLGLTVPAGHLLRLDEPKAGMIVTGKMMIVVGIG